MTNAMGNMTTITHGDCNGQGCQDCAGRGMLPAWMLSLTDDVTLNDQGQVTNLRIPNVTD